MFTELEQKESILSWNFELDELLYIDLIYPLDECFYKNNRTVRENSKISKQIFIKMRHNSVSFKIVYSGQ